MPGLAHPLICTQASSKLTTVVAASLTQGTRAGDPSQACRKVSVHRFGFTHGGAVTLRYSHLVPNPFLRRVTSCQVSARRLHHTKRVHGGEEKPKRPRSSHKADKTGGVTSQVSRSPNINMKPPKKQSTVHAPRVATSSRNSGSARARQPAALPASTPGALQGATLQRARRSTAACPGRRLSRSRRRRCRCCRPPPLSP